MSLLKMIPQINIRYKLAAAIILGMATLGLVVRAIIFTEIGWWVQIKIYFISIAALIVFVGVFFAINHWLNKIYPYERGVAMRVIIQLSIGFLFLAGIHTTIILFAGPNIPKGMEIPVMPDRKISLNKLILVAIYMVDFLACLAVNLGLFCENFFQKWKASFEKAERLEKEKAIVQYDNLKNQLNPHFLFNALASLNTLIYENQDQASQFLKQLSKVYRYLLENKELVSLRTELDFLQNFLSLLHIRFGKAISISLEVEKSMMDHQIVPVTLQNLIQNAIKHNTITEDRPLAIRIFSTHNCICVENNLQRKNIVESSNKQGLENLKNLYKFLTREELKAEATRDKFIVKVPLIS